MKEFLTFINIETYAKSIDESLTVKKFNHKKILYVKHNDGTELSLKHFLVEKVKLKNNTFNETVFIIYTEHHGYFIYCKSDLITIPKQFKEDE